MYLITTQNPAAAVALARARVRYFIELNFFILL